MDWDPYLIELEDAYVRGRYAGAAYVVRHFLSAKPLPKDLKALKKKIEENEREKNLQERVGTYESGWDAGAEYAMKHSLSGVDLPEDLKSLRDNIVEEINEIKR